MFAQNEQSPFYMDLLILSPDTMTNNDWNVSGCWLVLVFQPKEGILNFHPDLSESHTESSRKRLPNTCSTWIFFSLICHGVIED